MTPSFGDCESVVDYPLITVEEKRSKLTFRNPSRSKVRKIRVDDCVITEGLRCDWLLINHRSVEHFVELKGSDVRHAIQQIEVTIKKIGAKEVERRHAYIISTQVAPAFRTEVQTRKLQFKKEYNATLTIKNLTHEVDIEG